jgi:predicted RND superfamily exporter protein
MFSLFSRILKRTHRYPTIILVLSLLISFLMIIPVSKLKWELQLIDTLPESSETKKTALALEDEFGGLGTLTLILKSSDSLQNDRLVHRLVSEIKKNPLVSHVQFENDTHFYKENQFLYIRYQDLQDIHTRIKKLKEEKILQENPLWVNLMEADSLKEPTIEEVSFSDIEQKYLAKLKNSFQNDDGTIRVLDIYPTNNISSLSSSRKVYHSIKKIVDQENKDSIEVQYTGQVYHVIKTGKTLLPESQKMGFITAFFIAILLLIHFYKQPQLIIPAAFPISASIFWTLGLAYLLYGRINLFTLLLALIIPGHACQQIIHLLKRYAEERRQGLSPALSLESSILGIGPATAASSFITATTLLSLALMPLSGLQELGILGAIGVILNWLLANTLLPSILILLQRKKPFELLEPKEVFLINRKLTLSHPHPRFLLLFIFLLTIILATRGIIPKFEYDFSQTENLSQEIYVDSLLNETDYPNYDPVIVLFDDPSMSEVFYDAYLEKQKNKKTQTINSVVTYANLLPSQQEKKIEKLKEIRSELSPEILQYFNPSDSINIQKILNSWNVTELNESDLPLNIRHKFESKDGSLGKFAFIFPTQSTNDGSFCRRFTKEIKSILTPEGNSFPVTGPAIVRADILNLTLPYIHESIIAACIAILFLTLLLYNKLTYSIFVLTAPTVSFIWILSCISFLDIKLTAYSALAFPILIALSVDGSMQLWNVYFERSKTSALSILNRIGPSIFLSQMATLIGTYGLLLSSHYGLRSIGKISILGLFFIILSHFIFFPLMAISLDFYRLKKKSTHSEKHL